MPVTNYDTINGQIIGENTGGVQTNYMLDALGSVVGTKNSSGVVQNTYRHKPYGGLVAKTGTAADPKFLWNGGSGYRATQRAHSDYYVRARHFGSAEGLWTSGDSFWPGEPGLVYASCKPATSLDPSGRKPGNCLFGACPPFTCPLPKVTGPDGSQIQPAAITYCDFATGIPYVQSCADSCQEPCIKAHECVHVAQLANCCQAAAACVRAGGTDCKQLYGQGYKADSGAYECPAYDATISCFKGLQSKLNCLAYPAPSPYPACCSEYASGITDAHSRQIYYKCSKVNAIPQCPMPNAAPTNVTCPPNS